VYDQYRPAGLDGPLPRGPLGVLLGVADRLDTLAGMFGAGEVPSGSKDPFGLRRAALAVVRICAETNYPLPLALAVERALQIRSALSARPAADAKAALCAFMLERVRHYLTAAAGVSGQVADAVLEAGWDVVPDAVARARALEAVRQEPVFADLAVVFKRVRNLVAKTGSGLAADGLLREPAESGLLESLRAVEAHVAEALSAGDHGAGLRALARLAAPLDRFFTDVLVLCDDVRLRDARLALLARVEALFLRLADLSRLTPQN
jgi:glycyl-tRNA synthetase beta chain